jgi:capsular polysaccharide transport system permease protein
MSAVTPDDVAYKEPQLALGQSGTAVSLTLLRTIRRRLLFLVVVVVPTVAATAYYGGMATDVYVSESRFVIRSAQRQSSGGGIGALLQGAGLPGFQRSVDDAYAVQDFILSRDALQQLNSALNLNALFSDPRIDRISRFPSVLDLDDSFEGLHRYYQKQVEVRLDTASGIATLRARAFDADNAVQMNARLLQGAEQLVNQLNDRARRDLIEFAAAEVDGAERRAKEAMVAVSRFRSDRGVVDPERQTMLQLQQIAKLQDELIAAKTQIAQLKAFAPENPQLASLELRVRTLQGEMNAELGKVTGGSFSLTGKAADFQRLALEREFAERNLAATLANLEQARNEAQRKQLYLERIVQPSAPDVATEPRRMRAVLTVLGLSLLVWAIAALLIASVREHTD